MLKSIVLGQVRHFLGASGIGLVVWLTSHGASLEDANVIAASIPALVGFVWSVYDKYKAHKSITKPGAGNP